MCSVNTLLCINDIFDARGHDQPARTLAKQLRFNHQVFSCCVSHKQGRNQDFFGGTRNSLQMPLSPNPLLNFPKGEIIVEAFLLYTAVSRKVVGRNAHATIPKGNMGYDQYTVRND